MKANEIKRDAQDLQDETEFEVGDTAQKMRKVRMNDMAKLCPLTQELPCRSCCAGSTTS